MYEGEKKQTLNMIGWTICLSHSGGPIRSVTESLGFLLVQGVTLASCYPAVCTRAFSINLFKVGSKMETRPTRKAFCDFFDLHLIWKYHPVLVKLLLVQHPHYSLEEQPVFTTREKQPCSVLLQVWQMLLGLCHCLKKLLTQELLILCKRFTVPLSLLGW